MTIDSLYYNRNKATKAQGQTTHRQKTLRTNLSASNHFKRARKLLDGIF